MNDRERDLMFSSARSDWETPEWLLRRIEKEFGRIGLDVAANSDNNVAPSFFDPANDGLAPGKSWKAARGITFCNPPYSRTSTPTWVRRAMQEALDHGADVTCVIPARTETTWFHEVCSRGDIYFLKGRVGFCLNGEPQAPAPFPTAVVRFYDLANKKVGTTQYVDWREKK